MLWHLLFFTYILFLEPGIAKNDERGDVEKFALAERRERREGSTLVEPEACLLGGRLNASTLVY
jgi:hypothetical protein